MVAIVVPDVRNGGTGEIKAFGRGGFGGHIGGALLSTANAGTRLLSACAFLNFSRKCCGISFGCGIDGVGGKAGGGLDEVAVAADDPSRRRPAGVPALRSARPCWLRPCETLAGPREAERCRLNAGFCVKLRTSGYPAACSASMMGAASFINISCPISHEVEGTVGSNHSLLER